MPDPNHNHKGAIYQASNWAFIGTGGSKQEWLDRAGRVWHDREISKTGIKKVYRRQVRCPLPHELTKIPLKPKYKYAYAFEPEIRKQLFKLAKPYPK